MASPLRHQPPALSMIGNRGAKPERQRSKHDDNQRPTAKLRRTRPKHNRDHDDDCGDGTRRWSHQITLDREKKAMMIVKLVSMK
jgi:hypothetical protein